MRFKTLLILFSIMYTTDAILEGPFLFFGPKSLLTYKRSAFMYLEQDDLVKLYNQQSAIVVFKNQDPVPLAGVLFPQLTTTLESQIMLFLPQDLLDVHPNYIGNRTQVVTLQGPWSERDAQMKETFAKLQDVYGKSKVLGILCNSLLASYETYPTRKRSVLPVQPQIQRQEEPKPVKPLVKYALYNGTGPAGTRALFFSSGWPVLQFSNGTEITLSNPVGQPTVTTNDLHAILVVRYVDEVTKNNTTLEFIFKQWAGWWTAIGVEIKFGYDAERLTLKAPGPPDAPSAAIGNSYLCVLPLVYYSSDAKLTFPDIQMQTFMDNTQQFSEAYDCIGFTMTPISKRLYIGLKLLWTYEDWSGIIVLVLLLIGLVISIVMILDSKAVNHHVHNRCKQRLTMNHG